MQNNDVFSYIDSKVVETQERYATSHILHAFLSLITAGIWLIVWLLVADRNNALKKKAAKNAADLKAAIIKHGDIQKAREDKKTERLARYFGI